MTFYKTTGPRGTTALLGRALPTLGHRAFTAPTRSAPAPSFGASRQLAPGAASSRFAAAGRRRINERGRGPGAILPFRKRDVLGSGVPHRKPASGNL